MKQPVIPGAKLFSTFLGIFLILSHLGTQASAKDTDNLVLQIPSILAGANKLYANGGVFLYKGKAKIGYGACADIWRYEGCPNITRGTETSTGIIQWDDNIHDLVQNLSEYHFALIPLYEGLWQDSGSYDHVIECYDAYGSDEVYAMPYARSTIGTACDGRQKFNLEKFNQAFFDRYAQLAASAEQKGIIVDIAVFNQHRYLETDAHYQDQAWRPLNNINDVSMPDRIPAANSFYNNSANRPYQKLLIQKMLETIAPYRNAVLLSLAEEYTGGISFMNFFIDTIREWEADHNLPAGSIRISLAAPKNVLDYILLTRPNDIFAINLRYFFYLNGVLYQPPGGYEIPGRYSLGVQEFDGAANSTPAEIHKKTLEYRQNYPEKIIMDQIQGDVKQSWAFIMAKGSILVQEGIGFPGRGRYGKPIQADMSKAISKMADLVGPNYASLVPADTLVSGTNTWCLAAPNRAYVVFAADGESFSLDLSNESRDYSTTWIDPENGTTLNAGPVSGGSRSLFFPPGGKTYTLVLN